MRKIIILFLIFSLFTPNLALAFDSASTSANASPSARKALRQTSAEQNATDRLSKGIERGDSEIERRITSLTTLIAKIDSMKKLSESSKTAFASQIQAEIDTLNALKSKIDADTDIDTLKTDVQSIVKEYRVYLFYLPKMRILVAGDRLGTAADALTGYSASLSAKITDAETNGQDMTDAKNLLADLNTKISDAKTMYQQAVNLVTPLVASDWPNNKTTLQEAQSDIKEGASELRTAFNDAVSVRRLLHGIQI